MHMHKGVTYFYTRYISFHRVGWIKSSMIKAQKPSYTGHRQRIKDKYKNSGIDGWLDYEVLELVLSYAVARKDTKPIAKELITRFKTINAILDADREELKNVPGISEHTALFFSLL